MPGFLKILSRKSVMEKEIPNKDLRRFHGAKRYTHTVHNTCACCDMDNTMVNYFGDSVFNLLKTLWMLWLGWTATAKAELTYLMTTVCCCYNSWPASPDDDVVVALQPPPPLLRQQHQPQQQGSPTGGCSQQQTQHCTQSRNHVARGSLETVKNYFEILLYN